MNYKFWLEHPHLILARLNYWIWERLNPDKPWMCPGTINFCQHQFKGSIKALEFGSGRSTKWFANLTQHLTSIEHSPEWYSITQKNLQSLGISNVNYIYSPLDHPETQAESQQYDPLPEYVKILDKFKDGELDFVIVDGHYRTTCINHSIPKIRAGGYLLVDDVNLWPSIESLPIPSHWKIADDSTNGIKRCMIWQASTNKSNE
jgi:predicted O-methyltransferase YrrM